MTNALLTKLCSFVQKTHLDFERLMIQFVVVKLFNVLNPKRHHQVP